MILGVFDKDRPGSALAHDLLQAIRQLSREGAEAQTAMWSDRHVAICSIPLQIDTLDESPQPFLNEERTIAVMFAGKIHNAITLRDCLGSGHRWRTGCSGEVLVPLYEQSQGGFLDCVNGKFAFALWDAKRQTLILARDRFGIEPLFYYHSASRLVFSSSLKALLATGWATSTLNHEAVLQYLLYCYNPAEETFLRGIYKVPPGHFLCFNDSNLFRTRYWHLSFANTPVKSEEEYCGEILDLIADAIRIRLEPDRPPGVLLSGGTDSSAIVSLASRLAHTPLHTFSFRCAGRSYDESRYARLVAERCGAHYVEIPYQPDHLTLITRAVRAMDEPFCDIGIEIGTYLLGQAAEGKASYVFSGEGGDELFGGHPVYIASKVAAVVDRLPRPLLRPLTDALQRLPDSDQKKNLKVKLKRFAYSLAFPPELLSHRWRIYYAADELHELCSADFIEQCDLPKMFDGMLRYSEQADGRDVLSRSLYSDYQTLVGFYLRRLGLLTAFTVESRLPLLDHRLVEYAAKIPSRLKIRRIAETKYLYKKALENVVPREILYDRPKLGHSVPMKNWLRDDAKVRGWVADVLSDGAFKRRGLFRPAYVGRMVDEHMRKRDNHSHRLWGLMVLEFWLRQCFDAA